MENYYGKPSKKNGLERSANSNSGTRMRSSNSNTRTSTGQPSQRGHQSYGQPNAPRQYGSSQYGGASMPRAYVQQAMTPYRSPHPSSMTPSNAMAQRFSGQQQQSAYAQPPNPMQYAYNHAYQQLQYANQLAAAAAAAQQQQMQFLEQRQQEDAQRVYQKQLLDQLYHQYPPTGKPQVTTGGFPNVYLPAGFAMQQQGEDGDGDGGQSGYEGQQSGYGGAGGQQTYGSGSPYQ